MTDFGRNKTEGLGMSEVAATRMGSEREIESERETVWVEGSGLGDGLGKTLGHVWRTQKATETQTAISRDYNQFTTNSTILITLSASLPQLSGSPTRPPSTSLQQVVGSPATLLPSPLTN